MKHPHWQADKVVINAEPDLAKHMQIRKRPHSEDFVNRSRSSAPDGVPGVPLDERQQHAGAS
jgi:hypothetical protein